MQNDVTPIRAFYIPILQALARTDGKGRPIEIEKRVHQIMESMLRDNDYCPTHPPSGGCVGQGLCIGREMRWSISMAC